MPQAPQIIHVVWSPPPIRWLKVNTNGVVDGCLGLDGCGGYFVTSRCFIKGSFIVPLDSCYAYKSELLGVIITIECAKDFGEGNTVADILSKLDVSSSRVQWWWSLSDSCSSIHYRNLNGFENYRRDTLVEELVVVRVVTPVRELSSGSHSMRRSHREDIPSTSGRGYRDIWLDKDSARRELEGKQHDVAMFL
ncbi:hypothetical protein FNV43_RR21714 [Rhamnella rubrinervis]|uniref:RNase H type-1 domain-containing protein n=1 Tax=Rhamnella rubrinervis TaxID=2594499 RepID=A0A8K0DV49_9ROSA|nr:hypothetical protein FNV43_RR21714 [Rhamnella rubrinervis]